MPIEFRCRVCSALLRVADDAAGGRIRCGGCRTVLAVPVAAAPLAVPPEAPVGMPPAEDAPPRSRPTGAPRRSRPRPPRPAPRPFPIARVVLVLGVFGLLALAGIGYLGWRIAVAPAPWREYESARGGGFAVDLPAAPREDMAKQIGFPPRPGTTVEGTVRRRVSYSIVWSDFPNGRNRGVSDDQVLDAAVQGMRQEFAADRFGDPQRITVDGCAGREVVVSIAGEGTYVVCVVVAETRLYLVAAGGPGGSADHPDVRRFLDSFRVTDPQIRAALQRRLDEQKRAKDAQERWQEESRKTLERQREEAQRREEERQRWTVEENKRVAEEGARAGAAAAAEATKRRAAEADAEAFRVAPAAAAPDPTKLAGLKLYLSFDEDKGALAVWPKGEIDRPAELLTGPGARGKAIYFSEKSAPFSVAPARLPDETLNGPVTVAGWVKVRKTIGIDVLRAVSGQWDTDPNMRVGVIRDSFGRSAAHGRVNIPVDYWADPFPGETYRNALSARCPDDEAWHHVALTRSGVGAQARVLLYLDGELGATFALPPGINRILERVYLGYPTHAQRPFNTPSPFPYPDLPVAALDEVCVFDRAVTADEVRFLAGKSKAVAGKPAAAVLPLAPLPRPLAASRNPVPPATDFKGLLFYLDCDKLDDGVVIDAVSTKPVGKLHKPELVDGPRGNALRVTTETVPGGRTPVAGLALGADLPGVAADKPFTVALWARRPAGRIGNVVPRILVGRTEAGTLPEALVLYYASNGEIVFALSNRPGPAAFGRAPAPEPDTWVHIALARGEKNELGLFIDGVEVPMLRRPVFPGAVRYTSADLVFALTGKYTVDVDEFCLFGRALAADEVRLLAGKGKFPVAVTAPVPRPVVPAPAVPLALAPAPRELAPRPAPPPASPRDLPGLVYYLDCDESDGGKVTEGVSKRFVGRLHNPVLVSDGARGRALRLTSELTPARVRYSGLTLDRNAVAVPAGKPFTVALWARSATASVGKPSQEGVRLLEATDLRPGAPERAFQLFYSADGVGCFLLDRERVVIRALAADRTGWVHVAVTRDEQNEVRLHVNGRPAAAQAGTTFTGALDFSTVRLVSGVDGTVAVDVDDFCLFDRALTAAELERLVRPAPVVAPRVAAAPTLAPVPRASSRPPVPPATDFEGLLFYLDCDKLEDGAVRDAVSKKAFDKLHKPELVDGPRGKALRVTTETVPGGGRSPIAGLAFGADLPGVAADKPFTLALWARRPAGRVGGGVPKLLSGYTASPTAPQGLSLNYGPNGDLEFLLSGRSTYTSGKAPAPEPAEWAHVALLRGGKNELRLFVNGSEVPLKERTAFAGAVQYAEAGLVHALSGKYAIDVDEFCLFDRALTADEVKRLAGRGR